MSLRKKKSKRPRKHFSKEVSKSRPPRQEDYEYRSIKNVANEQRYDLTAFIDAINRLRKDVRARGSEREVGIIVTMDTDGHWKSSELVHGSKDSVDYNFSSYFSKDPAINAGLAFPQGTVHSHPFVDTKLNYYPSLGDIWNSAEMAQATGEWFVCGVVNHEGKATITMVHKQTYKDEGFRKLLARYNVAMDTSRQEVLAIEKEGLEYLIEKKLIKIYRVPKEMK